MQKYCIYLNTIAYIISLQTAAFQYAVFLGGFMKRREFLKNLCAGAMAMTTPLIAGALEHQVLYRRRNVLYMPVDDMISTAYTTEHGTLTALKEIRYTEATTFAADWRFYKPGTMIYHPLTDVSSQEFSQLPEEFKDYVASDKLRMQKFDGIGFITDKGSKVKGRRRIDVPIDNKNIALLFGKRNSRVYVSLSSYDRGHIDEIVDMAGLEILDV